MASNTASGLIQAPGRQTPGAAMPEVQVSETRAPEARAREMRAPETQTFRGQVSRTQVPRGQAPGAHVPGGHVPSGQAPDGQALRGQVPGGQVPGGQAPGLAHAPTAAAQAAEKPAVPAHMLPHRTPSQLLTIARQGLAEAANTGPDGLRYATAHLAALRAAAAVLAARARPATHTRRSRVTSAWSLLVLVAPEFSEWAGYFALGAGKRAAAEAGIPRVVTPREADDLLRAAEQFVAVVESALGLTYQPPLAA
jgi:HEPN superfamily protein